MPLHAPPKCCRWENVIGLQFSLVGLWIHIKDLKNKLLNWRAALALKASPLQISPQKAVVITDFCCRTSDVLIFYVYCSICICSERSKFVSVHLNSRRRGSPEHFPLNAKTGRNVFSSQDRLNVTLLLAFLF